jgi:hypothetical protein
MTKGNNGMSSKALRGSEISDQEKSVMLARLCGWKLEDTPKGFPAHVLDESDNDIFPWQSLDGDVIGWAGQYPNLYDPANMALLALVIEWACNGTRIDLNFIPKWNDANWEEGYFDNHFDPKNFHASMCRMADEILVQAAQYTELAAGMMTE